MISLNEFLVNDIDDINTDVKFDSDSRFWVRGGKGGLDIHDKHFIDIYCRFEEDDKWRIDKVVHVEEGEYAYIYTPGAANNLKYSGSFDIGGNLLGLTRREYSDSDSIKVREFWSAFADSGVVDCRELTITSDQIDDYGLAHMFDSCQEIIYSPELPATKLGKGCYLSMFEESNVKYACRKLPATKLAEKCYEDMYYSCWNLVDTPEALPAMYLAEKCYKGMFGDCNGLKKIKFKDLPATKMKEGCYSWMFNSSSIVNTPKIHAEELADWCFHGMFTYCNSIRDITFTSSKMKWNPITQADCFDEWSEEDNLPENVTLTISKNVEVDVPASWKIKRI